MPKELFHNRWKLKLVTRLCNCGVGVCRLKDHHVPMVELDVPEQRICWCGGFVDKDLLLLLCTAVLDVLSAK